MAEPEAPITAEREAIVRWRDPHEGLAHLSTLDGIEFLRRMASGELPNAPIASHVNMDLVEVDHGTVTFRGRPDESH